IVREVGKRTLNMRHFDVQLIGGMVLHDGKIAEMKTGEGKTLVLEPHLLDLAKNYEFDFIKIIMMMEENGIKLDTHALEILMKKF
ncbi:hypothetical protein VWM73_11245, partial [Campylobacter coli]